MDLSVFFSVSASALSIFSCVYTSGSACCYFGTLHTVRERALHPGRDEGQGSPRGVTTTLSWKYTCCRPEGRQDNKPLCSLFFIPVRAHRIIIWSEGKWHTARRCKCGWAEGVFVEEKIISVECNHSGETISHWRAFWWMCSAAVDTCGPNKGSFAVAATWRRAPDKQVSHEGEKGEFTGWQFHHPHMTYCIFKCWSVAAIGKVVWTVYSATP